MIYYTLYTGHGPGCHYTIDCNKTFERLEATTLEQARREAVESAPNGLFDSRDRCYTDKILLLAVAEEHDLSAEIAVERTRVEEERNAAVKAKKLAEFERLKLELGQ